MIQILLIVFSRCIKGLIGGYGISGFHVQKVCLQFPQLACHLIQLEDSLLQPDPFLKLFEGYSGLKGRSAASNLLKADSEAFKMVPQLQSIGAAGLILIFQNLQRWLQLFWQQVWNHLRSCLVFKYKSQKA